MLRGLQNHRDVNPPQASLQHRLSYYITTECRMAEWRDGRMAEWRDGRMAEWRNGGMVFYYIPNLSCYIYGNANNDDDADNANDTDSF
jgi:hypothetical protein